MNKHTPGPWHVGGQGKYDKPVESNHLPRVWGPDHAGIADLCTRRRLSEGTSDIEIANARLIAAAPDLLAALKLAEKAMQADYNGNMVKAFSIVREAIKRAEG